VIGQIPARCRSAISFGPVCDQDSVMEFGFKQCNSWRAGASCLDIANTWSSARQSARADIAHSANCRMTVNYLSLFALLCENRTSSTEPEVHGVLHRRHRATEPRPQVKCTGNSVKFGHEVFDICEPAHRQTDKLTDGHTDTKTAILRTPPGGGRSIHRVTVT